MDTKPSQRNHDGGGKKTRAVECIRFVSTGFYWFHLEEQGGETCGETLGRSRKRGRGRRRRRRDAAVLKRRQRSHRVPGRQRSGFLLHNVQNVGGQELLVHHNLIDKLGEPVVGHYEVTCGDKTRQSELFVFRTRRRALS